MTSPNKANIKEVALPFSNGLIAARMWKAHGKFVVGVPALGIHCYGKSEQEAAFRLFTTLLKYYRQLKQNKNQINQKGRDDLALLTEWVNAIENKMTAHNDQPLSRLGSARLTLL